uniref:C1q domain-containing protein n=1 Tax=Astyanax mexicanus TaxID=7994 RepID=A0A3B1IN83_ASTMX
MRTLIFIAFSLYHFTVAQVDDGGSTGSQGVHSEYSEHYCSPKILSELKELKSLAAEQKTALEELKKQAADKPNVAFSASLFGEGGQTLGGYNSEVVLKFQKVFVNIGHAYNPSTGTAPLFSIFINKTLDFVSHLGVYYFGFSAFANGKNAMGVHLRKRTEHNVNGANRAILLLEKGDQVNIGLWSGLSIFDSYNSVSTFSGFLLFKM